MVDGVGLGSRDKPPFPPKQKSSGTLEADNHTEPMSHTKPIVTTLLLLRLVTSSTIPNLDKSHSHVTEKETEEQKSKITFVSLHS